MVKIQQDQNLICGNAGNFSHIILEPLFERGFLFKFFNRLSSSFVMDLVILVFFLVDCYGSYAFCFLFS